MRPEGIDPFKNYLERNKVIKSEADLSEAKGLLKRGKRKFKNMEKLGIDEETATDYFENLYESIKMLIQAFMALDGYNPYSHKAIIAYAVENLDLSKKEANKLNKYRKLRNDISYRGDIATEKEAKAIKELFKGLLDRLEPKLKDRI